MFPTTFEALLGVSLKVFKSNMKCYIKFDKNICRASHGVTVSHYGFFQWLKLVGFAYACYLSSLVVLRFH